MNIRANHVIIQLEDKMSMIFSEVRPTLLGSLELAGQASGASGVSSHSLQ